MFVWPTRYYVVFSVSGDEAHIQDFIPISPAQVFNPETGQLTQRDESQMSPRQRRILNKKLAASPLVTETVQEPSNTDEGKDGKTDPQNSKPFLPGQFLY